MKRRIINIISSILMLLAFLFIIWLFLVHQQNRKMEIKGSKLIDKIEEYRQKNGQLPNTVKEMGLEESEGWGPFYEKIDNVNYKVYFSIGFDNSKEYYSKTKKWEDKP